MKLLLLLFVFFSSSCAGVKVQLIHPSQNQTFSTATSSLVAHIRLSRTLASLNSKVCVSLLTSETLLVDNTCVDLLPTVRFYELQLDLLIKQPILYLRSYLVNVERAFLSDSRTLQFRSCAKGFVRLLSPVQGELVFKPRIPIQVLIAFESKNLSSFDLSSWRFCASFDNVRIACSISGKFTLQLHPKLLHDRNMHFIKVWIENDREELVKEVCYGEKVIFFGENKSSSIGSVVKGSKVTLINSIYQEYPLPPELAHLHNSFEHCFRMPFPVLSELKLVIINSLAYRLTWHKYISLEYFHLLSQFKAPIYSPIEFVALLKTIEPPATILLFEYDIRAPGFQQVLDYILQHPQIKVHVFCDDLHNCGFPQASLELQERATSFISSYSYLASLFFPSFPFQVRWLPHSAIPVFQYLDMNLSPVARILITGNCQADVYPLRAYAKELAYKRQLPIDYHPHPGYEANAFEDAGELQRAFAQVLHSYLIVMTSMSRLQYAIAKLFEIPATGALLLINSDGERVLHLLGFAPFVHYVGYDPIDPLPTLEYVLNPLHRRQIDQIRRNGMELVQQQHLSQHRVKLFHRFITTSNDADPVEQLYQSFDDGCPVLDETRQECHEGWVRLLKRTRQ